VKTVALLLPHSRGLMFRQLESHSETMLMCGAAGRKIIVFEKWNPKNF
jgi:hypothetical protein